MTDVPPPSEPPPQAEPAPQAPSPSAPAPASRPPWLPIAVGAAVVLVLVFGFVAMRGGMGGAPAQNTYSVQPFTPPSQLVSARDHMPARVQPDDAAPIVVEFGPGVDLNVNGRVSRGLGGEWYAVGWNGQTVFVRTQDAIAGNGAPPTPEVREEQPEEEKERPPTEQLDEEEPDQVAEAEPAPQPSFGLEISDVNWIREPSARDFARYYPTDALDNNISGRVTLDCVIGGGGGLNCSVVQESPGGNGFGQAALNISRQVRVRSRLADGSPAAGRHLRLPLSFRAG